MDREIAGPDLIACGRFRVCHCTSWRGYEFRFLKDFWIECK